MTTPMVSIKIGDVLEIDGTEHVVWYVNDCRAAVVPLSSSLQHRVRNGEMQFRPRNLQESINISPNSEGVSRRLGVKGLIDHLNNKNQQKEQKKEQNTMKKETKQNKNSETPTRGKLGELLGHSVVSVIRLMGSKGWDFERARAALTKAKIDAADATIKIQLRAGKNGQGEVAAVTLKDLEALAAPSKKPAKADKPAKGDKPAKKPAKGDKPAKPAKVGKKVKPVLEEEEEELVDVAE